MRIRQLIALLALVAPSPAVAQDLKSTADALGIKTVLVPTGTKIADLVNTEGTLLEVPLANLEARLGRALQKQVAAKKQPRLVKSTYRAELVGNHLSGGGHWVVDHPGVDPAIVPLTSFNLALKQPRLEGERAILGDLTGANLGLWIEKPGTQALVFDWSLHGTPGVHGIAFDLRVPPCPLIAIELKLPADHSLALPKAIGMLTGPLATENPAFKLWKLQVAGRSQIELLVRRGNEASRTPQLFSLSDTRVQFSPEQTLYECDVQVEALHAPVGDLVFEVDSSLNAYDVTSRPSGVQSWRVESGASNRSLLKVQLREPLLGSATNLRLRFSGPRWTDHETSLPRIDLVGAVSRGETLKLHLHPDQHLERWDAGAFRLVNSSTGDDGSQVMALADTRPGKGPMPRFLLRTQGVDFTVNQDTRWRIDPGSMTLTSDIQYDISRGQLYSLDVRLPKTAPWRVVGVDLQPAGTLQKWTIAGGILHVDLQSGITPRTDCKLTVQLQDERDKSLTKPKVIDFPDLEPLGAVVRQGSLAILTDAHQHVSLAQSNLPTSSPEPTLAKDPRLQFFFAFRQTPLQGKIRLAPQQPILQARTQQHVVLAPDAVRVKANVTIEPVVGQPTYVDLFFSDSSGAPWKIEAKGTDIASQQRIPLAQVASLGLRLGASNWRGVAATAMLETRGQVWRIQFREPLTKAIVLVAQRELPREDFLRTVSPPILALDYGIDLAAETIAMRTESDWRVPIVLPLDAERVDGEVSLQPLGISLRGVASHGLEATTAKTPQGSAFARVFRFRHVGLLDAPTLQVKTQRRPRDDAAQAIIDLAELTTSIDAAGNVSYHLRASVWNWRARDFRIGLPPGTSVVAARLNQVDLDRIPRHDGPNSATVFVPMAHDHGAQVVELTYRGTPPSWLGSLGRVVDTPLPMLPSPPLLVRREVRLAPGWLPLRQEDTYSIDRHAPARAAFRGVWNVGEGLIDEFVPSAAPAWVEPQRLSLLGAEGAFRRSGVREAPLGEAFGRLLFDAKNDPPMIVIDRAALRVLGLSSKAVVAVESEGSAPFWDKLGLAYVATPHAALLTTKDRAAAWARAIRDGDVTGGLVSDAVRQAAERGQDASGRFHAADFWLRSDGRDDRSAASTYFAPEQNDVTIWQPLPGRADVDSFVVVRRTHLRGLAVLFGLLVLGAGLVLRRVLTAVPYFRAVWMALTTCLAGFAVVPSSIRELMLGPTVAIVVLLVVSYRRLLARIVTAPAPTRSGQSKNIVKPTAGAALFVVLASWGLGQAQAPAVRTIFLLGTTANDKPRALVTPETLRWLDDLDKQSRAAIDDVIVLGARYQGRWEQNAVTVRAEFDLVAFKDKATFVLPLAGVDMLDGSILDESPALPVVAPAGKTGYQIDVAKKGTHRLTISFLVRPLPLGEIKFSVPRTPCSSVKLVAPAKLGMPRLARCWGQESLSVDAKSGEQTLEAQLGNEAVVQIFGLGASPAAANLNVRELYYWDLRPGNHSAQAVLAFVPTGEVPSVEIRLPSSLEIRTVDLADSSKTAGAIKTWGVTPPQGDNRVLKIEFLQPISGPFEVLMNMTPLWSNGSAIDLRLPFPLRAALRDGMIGVRVDEPGATEKAQFLGVAAITPDAFVKEWTRLSQREISAPLRAFSFARAAKNPSAALEVTPLAAKPRVQTDVAWTAQAKTIDLAARLNVSSTEDFYLLPIDLPDNVVLRDVQGDDVHHWSRLGRNLQVWLVGPRKKTSLTFLGWTPHSFPKTTTLNLPAPHLVGAILEPATLTLASAAGYALDPKSATSLDSVPAEGALRRFRVATGAIPSFFQLRSQAAAPEFQTLTTAEIHDGVGTIATHVHGRIDHGNFPELHVRQSNSPTPAPRLLLSMTGAKVKYLGSPPGHSNNDHAWIVTFPPGTPQQVSFSIAGQVPLKAGATFTLPELRIERGGQVTDRIVALSGARLAGAAPPFKVANVRSSTKDLFPWPLEHARLRAAGAQFGKWPATVPTLLVQPNEELSAAPVQTLAARHRILVGQHDRWLHRMTWLLWVKSGHDLEIALPVGAALEAAFVDDQPATLRQTGSETISLSLAAGQKPRAVVVCWTFAAAKESFAQPRLAPAVLLGLESIGVEGSLDVPPGWRPTSTAWIASEADVVLADLQAEQRTLSVISDDPALTGRAGQGALTPCLQSFALLARQAQYRIRFEADAGRREKLDGRLEALIADEQKQAKTLGIDAGRVSPWPAAPRLSFAGADAGMPLAWTTHEGSVPHVELWADSEPVPQMSLLPIAIVVFVLSFWPGAIKMWVKFWPEQLAAVAAIGVAFAGFSLLAAALILLAIACRGVNVAAVIRRRLRPANGVT